MKIKCSCKCKHKGITNTHIIGCMMFTILAVLGIIKVSQNLKTADALTIDNANIYLENQDENN